MPTVVIAADEMAADLVLAEGERLASTSAAVVLLARHGVRHGLVHAEIARLAALTGPAAARVALGEPSLAGRDGRVVYGFPLPDAIAAAPPAPPRAVEEGEVLARLYPATLGQPGSTVTGRALGLPAPAEPALVAGDGCELTMDGQFLVASRPGVPHRVGDAVIVRPLALVEGDLDADAAPIVAPGDVFVAGWVEHPATIAAAGDIYVAGGVRGALLRADGRIVVAGGVRQEARLEAGAGVHVKFLEQSVVVATGPVAVAEDAVRCTLAAPAARIGGAVVGGELELVAWLEAGELGAELAVPTRVAVVPPPPPEDPLKAVARERREIADQLTRLGLLLDENRRLAKDPRNEGAREMATKVVGLIAHLQARDRTLAAEAAAVPPALPGPRPFVRVAGLLHPGVSLQVGGQHLRPASPIPASTFLEGAGAVEIAPHDLDLAPPEPARERTPA